MKVDLNSATPLRSEPVQLPEGEFHVHVKSPTYAELIKDMGKFEDFIELRMRATIVGWTGLVQEVPPVGPDAPATEEEIPFTWENVVKLCEKYPAALHQLARIANRTYAGVAGEAASKNVRPASALFSADAVIRQMGLSSGSTSGGSVVLQSPPDSEPKP